jgi:hypothetical protein
MTTFYAGSIRFCRAPLATVLLLALAWPIPAGGADKTEFRAALAAATMQYRVAMSTLERSGQEDTAAEVRHFRHAWQAVIERAGANRPAAYATTEEYYGMLMQVDTSIVGALLVIDLGSRDAARNSLAPIEEILLRMQDDPAPPG